jgi:colanic acid/amylovoran biosynthesis protein
MKIFVIGQCTLHWGRMEFGNIGNYYIIEPFFRELHRVFPDAEIVTTMQMTDEFCEKEKVTVVPLSLYYEWKDTDLSNAYKEFAIATIYKQTGKFIDTTPYIDEVLSSDLVIDFSGDMWGDNTDLAGKNRFLVGLLKDRTAQLLGKPTAMLAGSPGPFTNQNLVPFAKEVFKGFSLVTNRERISSRLLKEQGFESDNAVDLTCPSFLFEATSDKDIELLISNTPIKYNKPIFGFILCGWNFLEAPFSKFPREDIEYKEFMAVIEYIVKKLGGQVCLMSHSNGFELPPNFKLIHGRDYPIVKQLYSLIIDEDVKNNVFLLDGIYSPAETKAIIRHFDMLISGRVHGAIAGLSQSVPTVIIDYGHEPKAHKLKGFAQICGMENYVANPALANDIIEKIKDCWFHKTEIRQKLNEKNIEIKKLARKNFELLKK